MHVSALHLRRGHNSVLSFTVFLSPFIFHRRALPAAVAEKKRGVEKLRMSFSTPLFGFTGTALMRRREKRESRPVPGQQPDCRGERSRRVRNDNDITRPLLLMR